MFARVRTCPMAGLITGLCLFAAPSAAMAQGTRPAWMPDIPLSPAAQANGVQRSWEYGHEWVTVTASGNDPLGPYVRQPTNEIESLRFSTGQASGRGAVDHDFRISRFETTSQNWRDFMAAVSYVNAHEGPVPYVTTPNIRANPMGAVGGVTWRTAAIYCNWLHNNQALTRDAFMSGAYDVSTFGYIFGTQTFTDQLAHSPGARFWIPTWDEWLVSAHYDANRFGAGAGGYWAFPTTTDVPPIYGPPSSGGQSNANWAVDTSLPFSILLGSYSVQSPWGLLDCSGETGEWTEEVLFGFNQTPVGRIFDGSFWARSTGIDFLSGYGSDLPSFGDLGYGFRIAGIVPGPSSTGLAISGMLVATRRRRHGLMQTARDDRCSDGSAQSCPR